MEIIKILIERYSPGEKQTIGNLIGISDVGNSIFTCDTLELPWLGNKNKISCISIGLYKVKKRYSKKYGWHLHIQDVEGRTYILIHSGNYYTQILGCILVGKLGFVNTDDIVDVADSRKTLKKLLSLIKEDEIDLEIINRA